MKKHFLIAGAAVLALGLSANQASAQCAFAHPSKAKETKTSFVQAMVSCGNAGGNPISTSTQTGVPACKPPETFNTQAGDPPTGWLFGPKGTATVSFKSSKNKVVGPLNPPNTADIAVSIKMADIQDAAGSASGVGTLNTLSRATIEDRTDGDMTIIDFAVPFPIPLTEGKANVKTSANTILNASFSTSLPGCTAVQVVEFLILDENGTVFGSSGVWLPDLPQDPP